jgi:hypothetical protein
MKKKTMIDIYGLVAWIILLVVSAAATAHGEYEIVWSTIDGGGGQSSGGPYVLTGTIGQPDAGYSEGGSYELLGGFWPGGQVQAGISATVTLDNLWMYQNLPGAIGSKLTVSVSITDDPYGNTSYSYQWEFMMPADVSIAPTTVDGGGSSDAFWTFAARGCNEPTGISDSGLPFTVKVIVTGNDYGNTGTAEAQFGIALLGDINNNSVVNAADRGIINAFWRTGAAGPFTLRDCDINCNSVVNAADRGIANAIWRGALGQNSVSAPCPFR